MSRIVIDARLINNSGIGTYIRNVLPLVIKTLYNHEFLLLVDQTKLNSYSIFLDITNVKFIHCISNIYTFYEQYEILKKIPSHVDLFWSPHYVIPVFFSGKILTTIHDVCHLAFLKYSSNYFKKLYAKSMIRMASSKSCKIITVSNFSKQEILRYTNTDPTKIKVIYNGIDSHFKSDSRNDNLSHNPYIMFLGNIKPNKNLLRLLIAFEKKLSSIPHSLVIVGKKEGFIGCDPEVFEYANKLNDRVKFTGFLEISDLVQLLQNASALIFPSLYEGFGLPPLEAMACGCPVAVSSAASMPEICGDAALYFDPYDVDDIAHKIYCIVSNKVLAQSLVEDGKVRADKFDWNHCVDETCKVIERILSPS